MAYQSSPEFPEQLGQLKQSTKRAKRWNLAKNVFTGSSLALLVVSIGESNAGARQESNYALYGAGVGIALTIGALTMAGIYSERTDKSNSVVQEIETDNLQEFAREDLASIVPLASLMSGEPTRSSE